MGSGKDNAIKPGTDIVRELTVKKLRELAGRDLSMAKYPLYCYFDEPRFQMANLTGIDGINAEALKELSLNNCRLTKLAEIDMFIKLKRLWASGNNIKKVQINFAALELLDVSKNGLFEIPDLSGCPNLKELDVSKNKIRGVWVNLLHCRKLERLNLQKNKLKWTRDDWERSLGILQAWPKLKELNFMGNKVHKTEGYRYYVSHYARALKLLDGVENDGDADPKNRPPNAMKVKPLQEVLKYYELRAKVMANPDLLKKPAGNVAEGAEGEEGERGEGEEEEEDEMNPEDLGPHVRVLMSDLCSQLAKCFEGPKEGQAVMKRLDVVITKLTAAAPEHRILFEKGSDPAEILEDFLQTFVVAIEKDDSILEPGLTVLVKMLALSNHDIGSRCLVQMKDLVMSSAKYSEAGIPLLLDICVPRITHPATPVNERDLLITAMYEIDHEDVTSGMEPVIKFLCDLLKQDLSRTPDSIMGLLGAAANDDELNLILRKEKIMNVIADMLKEVSLMQQLEGKGKSKLTEEDMEGLARRFTALLTIIGGMSSNDLMSAEQYAKKGVHVELLAKMSALLQDADALRLESTWLNLGQIITCISGLCNDQKALSQAMQKGFLDQLVVVLAQEGLPCALLAAAYRSLRQILEFSVPPDPCEGIDDDPGLTLKEKEKKKRAAIREAAMRDVSDEDWLAVRIRINEVLGNVTPLLPYLGGHLYQQLCRKLMGEVPALYRLTNKDVLNVMAAVVELLAFYGARAEEVEVMDEVDSDIDEDEVPLEDRTYTTFVLDLNAQEICTDLDDNNRDNLLFNLMDVPDDDVRLGAVTTLCTTPLSNFDTAEIATLIKCIAETDDPSAGRSEEVLAGLFSILEKFASLPPTNKMGIDFRKKFSRSIFVVLEVLGKICANDARSSLSDLQEKEILANAAVSFLQACSKWREAPALMGSREAIARMKEILSNEDKFGDETRPARIEATAVGGSVRSLMKVYEEQAKTGTVAARILNRISELMEGPEAASAFKIEVESAGTPMTWQKMILTRVNDPPAIREKRFDEQRQFFHLDGFKNLLSGLINEAKRVRKLDPKGLVALAQEEAERVQRMKEDALLADMSDDDAPAEDVVTDGEDIGEEEEEEEEEENLGDDEDEDDETVLGNLSQPWQKCGDSLGEELKLGRALRIVQTCRTFVAFLRLCCSLLWYGEKDKAEAVRFKLRELRVLQNMAFMSMRAGHFAFNVGAKICMLMEELLRIPPGDEEESPDSILLYEVAVKFIQDIFKSFEKRLAKGITVTRREEALLMRVTSLWALLTRQCGDVCFSEDDEVDEICDKFIGTQLFPITMVNTVLLWLYYDVSLAKTEWGWNKQSLFFREGIRTNIKIIVAAFLRNSPDFQFEILVHINRLQVQWGLNLQPSYLCELLLTADSLAYQYAIARHIHSEGHSDATERVREHKWLWLGGVKDPPRRLLVCTNRAIYVFRNSWNPPCSVCTSDLFCPDGPVLLHKIEYDSVLEILRGFGGNMFRLVYENRGVYTTEDSLDFISDSCGVVDVMIECINSGIPPDTPVDMRNDQMTWLQISKQINGGETKLDMIENMVMLYNKIQVRHATQNKKTGDTKYHGDWQLRSAVLTAGVPLEFQITADGFTTDAQIELKKVVVFKEDHREWQKTDFMNGEPSDTFANIEQEFDIGGVKCSNPLVEPAILRLHEGEEITEFMFGNTETVKQWIRMIHWYTDGGFPSKAPPVIGEAESAGKKKK